jgi:hypothetical protein
MAILSPLHLEGWEIGRAPTLPVSRTFWIINHTFPLPPLPSLPHPPPPLTLSPAPALLLSISFFQHKGPPPLVHMPARHGSSRSTAPHLLRAGCCTSS